MTGNLVSRRISRLTGILWRWQTSLQAIHVFNVRFSRSTSQVGGWTQPEWSAMLARSFPAGHLIEAGVSNSPTMTRLTAPTILQVGIPALVRSYHRSVRVLGSQPIVGIQENECFPGLCCDEPEPMDRIQLLNSSQPRQLTFHPGTPFLEMVSAV